MSASSCTNAGPLKLLIAAIALATATPAVAQQAAKPAELPPVVVEGSQAKAKPSKKVAKKSVAPKAKAAPAAPAPQPDESAAAAAGAEETAKGAVDGVVAKRSVSGTKTDTPIISTPQSISVVGREQMERQGAQTIPAAMRYAPGVRADTFGNDTRNDWFLLRGFQAQTNGYYLDGLQLYSTSFATWKIEPWGLDRLEIIRGPSSALYGGGNPAGLINGVSKRPGADPIRTISTGIDEYGNGFGALDVGGEIGSGGQLFYRLNTLGRLGETEVDDIDNDRFFIAPSLLWRPNLDTSITLLGSYQKDRTAVQNFLPYTGTVVPSPVFGRIPTSLNVNNPGFGEFTREQTMVGYEFEHRLSSALNVRQNLRYGTLDIDLIGAVGNDNPATAGFERYAFLTTPHAEQLGVDNQAELRVDTGVLKHKVLAGLDYGRYKLDDEQGAGGAPDLNILTRTYPPVAAPTGRYILNTTTLEQLGLYLQDEIKVDRFTVLLTGRHDWINIDRDDKLPGAPSTYEDTDSAFTYRAAAIYNFDNGIAPYVAYSTSFDPQLGVNPSTQQPFLPEEGEGFEAGLKYEPRWMNARFTAAYFDLTKTNVSTALVAAMNIQRQIGEVRSQGFEFEAVATLMPGLNLTSSYTIYDLETTVDGDPARLGKVPKFTPEQFGGAYLDYTFQDGWAEGFGFGGGVRYVGRSFADDLNQFAVPSYTLADASVHYERDGWLTALTVSNLFDDTYVSGCNTLVACFYGERRKAMVTATYKW
jgi:iron complex outermembrane receptor protein